MTNPSVTLLTVDPEDHDQRIDNFLFKTLKGVPKSLVYRILRTGEVRVNKGRIKPFYRLVAGDQIRIPPLRVAAATEQIPLLPKQIERWPLTILYEDPGLLVVDKPSGLAVHGGSGLSYGLIEALRAARPQQSMLELVHRLDRDTSGCILIAKKKSVLRELHEGMRQGTIHKRYTLLVSGPIEWQKRTVRLALRKNTLQSGERMVFADPAGQPAVTHFRCLQTGGEVSLLEADLETGRTHQIRVHAAASGFPIAGDEKYGRREDNQRFAQRGLRRLFLHAGKIEWKSPSTGQNFRFESPLPDVLKQLADDLLGTVA